MKFAIVISFGLMSVKVDILGKSMLPWRRKKKLSSKQFGNFQISNTCLMTLPKLYRSFNTTQPKV